MQAGSIAAIGKGGDPAHHRISLLQSSVLMVHLFVVMGMAVRHRLVFMVVGMLPLFLIVFMMLILTVGMIMLHRFMLVRFLFHRTLLI